jgi:hypothetical protein
MSLRAGPLSLEYQGGDLRYVRLGSQEILRRVYVAVRDHNWDTVPCLLSNLEIDARENSFKITYDAEHRQKDVHFIWSALIEGDSDGTLRLRMHGKALSTFRRCRIGFCILHPMDCAGVECRIEHVNGRTDETRFPQQIAAQVMEDGHPCPVTPFVDMKSLSHRVKDDLWAEVRFEGEVFELEDQRNWTDASYKTYGTPLALPFPVEIEKGTEITQSVTLSLKGSLPASVVSSGKADTRPSISITEDVLGPVAPLGLERVESSTSWTAQQLNRLRQLHLSHLRTEVRLSQEGWPDKLRRAWNDAQQLSAELEVALFLGEDTEEELRDLAALLEEIRPSVSVWLVYHEGERTTGNRWVDLVRDHLSTAARQEVIGSGTNAFFADLNRDKPAAEVSDVISYSINPQVHAFDNASVVETLEAQEHTIESAFHLCGDTPVRISPITFRMRSIPHISGPQPEPLPGELPFQVDPRQTSLFGAAWTVGSLSRTLGSGLHGVTYYETTGWRGVMETEEGSALPQQFPSIPDAVFPLYHVLADVGEVRSGRVLRTTTTDPLMVDSLAIRHDKGTRILVTNFSGETQGVELHLPSNAVLARFLDESNAEVAMVNPEAFRTEAGERLEITEGCLSLNLRPHAVARLDSIR